MPTKLAALIFGLVVCGMPFAQTTPSQEAEIVRFVRSYDNASNHKDRAALDRILAPEYVYFSSEGQVRSRQYLLNMLLSSKYTLASAERTELKVYVTSDTAVVSSRWKGHGTYDGQPFNDDQRCSIVLARAKEKWLVSSEHCTQIVAP